MLKNGEKWLDTQGNEIHAHGGCMLKIDKYIYWYGEDRRKENYVSCYRSVDLKTWEFRNTILTRQSIIKPMPHVEISNLKREFFGKKVVIERPKIEYCEKTKKYVLWGHYENGKNYDSAMACIASCDTPDGDFTYHGAFRPFGNMSRDCTLYRDGDKVYFISAANDNEDLIVYRLSEDLLNVQSQVLTLWPGKLREAPVVFQKDEKYFMLSSACTGWTANQGKFAESNNLENGWSDLHDFGDETTFHSQPTWVLEKDGKYIYIGDRWGGDKKKYFKSTYVFLELKFNQNKLLLDNSDNAFLGQ